MFIPSGVPNLFYGDLQLFIDSCFPDFPLKAFKDVVHEEGYPIANIYVNEEKAVRIELAVTGMSKKDIQLDVEDNCILIKGTLPEKDTKWKLVEGKIKKISFEKRIKLPNRLDYTQADAEIKDGLLTITIPPKESSLKKQILIK